MESGLIRRPSKLFAAPRKAQPARNASRDRSLPGKKRIRARRAARRRTYFFRGHGLAGANDYNLRYDCHAPDCGFGIFAPLDDFDFMTDVMDHESTHEEVAS